MADPGAALVAGPGMDPNEEYGAIPRRAKGSAARQRLTAQAQTSRRCRLPEAMGATGEADCAGESGWPTRDAELAGQGQVLPR